MRNAKLWISFHHQDEEIDHWAIYLDTESIADCDIWQASGQTFEFEHTHIRGMRPEVVANFREKWLLKDNLTIEEVGTVRNVADNNPVDNEAAFWDCRIFCFEVLASLEVKGVLVRADEDYRLVRGKLHAKWKSDDGISHSGSDEEEVDHSVDGAPDLTRVNDSDLENDSVVDGEASSPVTNGIMENHNLTKKRGPSPDSVEGPDTKKATLEPGDCTLRSTECLKAQ